MKDAKVTGEVRWGILGAAHIAKSAVPPGASGGGRRPGSTSSQP